MYSFLPSMKQLFEALNFDWPEPDNEEEARDAYAVTSALTDWENTLYRQLSDNEFTHGAWPASPELLAALRAALADHRGNYAGDRLAYCLVRCGCREPETIAGLCAWDAQLFRWSAAGFSAEDLLAKFEAIGVAGNPAAEDLEKLNRWLSDPAAALANYSSGNITGTVLKGRGIIGSLYDNGGCPAYGEVFQELVGHAEPALPILRVNAEPVEDEDIDPMELFHAQIDDAVPQELIAAISGEPEVFWRISFDFDGASDAVIVPGSYSWVNDAAVALQIDAILARRGRPERVLRFGNGRNDEGSFWGQYIIAHPRKFSALCSELGIPLNDFTGSLRA